MKLSVLFITYNQEQYVAQALESALMQQTDFDYEIVIGEDCSSDNTRSIVSEIAGKHSSKVRLLPSPKNLGMTYNFSRTLSHCSGQYIALLEGDDYWSSPNKLQKQVDYMDADPRCSICFHSVNILNAYRKQDSTTFPCIENSILTFNDLINGNFIPTCSTVFRNKLFRSLPDWTMQLRLIDWPLHILNSEHGHIKYFNDTMATYRIHEDGVWSCIDEAHRLTATIQMFVGFSTHYQDKRRRLVNAMIAKHYCELATVYKLQHNTKMLKQSLRRAMTIDLQTLGWVLKNRHGSLLRLLAPRIHEALKGPSHNPCSPPIG